MDNGTLLLFPFFITYLAFKATPPVVRIPQPSVPNYTSERVSFGRYKTHELVTPRATVKYVTRRTRVDYFPIVVMEISAEILFEVDPATPGFVQFHLYRGKGRYTYLSTPCSSSSGISGSASAMSR